MFLIIHFIKCKCTWKVNRQLQQNNTLSLSLSLCLWEKANDISIVRSYLVRKDRFKMHKTCDIVCVHVCVYWKCYVTFVSFTMIQTILFNIIIDTRKHGSYPYYFMTYFASINRRDGPTKTTSRSPTNTSQHEGLRLPSVCARALPR